jgi:hypothetical protein
VSERFAASTNLAFSESIDVRRVPTSALVAAATPAALSDDAAVSLAGEHAAARKGIAESNDRVRARIRRSSVEGSRENRLSIHPSGSVG